MVMEWAKFNYKPLLGVDQFNGQLSFAPGQQGPSLVLENVVIEKNAKLSKRGGIRREFFGGTGAEQVFDGPKRIASGKNELVVIDNHHLWSYSPTTKQVTNRGLVSPCSLKQDVVNASEETQKSSLVAKVANAEDVDVLCVVAGVAGTSSHDTEEVEICPILPNGSPYGPRHRIPCTGRYNAVGAGEWLVIGVQDGSSVRLYTWSASAPEDAPVVRRTQSGVDTAVDPMFDLLPWPSSPSTFFFAFVDDSTGNVRLQSLSVNQSTGAISIGSTYNRTTRAGNYRSLSLGYDGIHSDVILVSAATVGGANPPTPLNPTTLYVDIATHNNVTGLTQDLTEFVAVEDNGYLSTTPHVMASWVESAVGNPNGVVVLDRDSYISFRLDTGAVDPTSTIQNARFVCKPWTYNSRFYGALANDLGEYNELTGCNWIADLNVDDQQDLGPNNEGSEEELRWLPEMVGCWNVLNSASRNPDVATLDTAEFEDFLPLVGPQTYLTAQYLSFVEPNSPTNGFRTSSGFVTLDYTFRPQTTKSVAEGLFVTGALASWYDGSFVQELGFTECPFIAEVVEGSSVASRDRTFQTMWSYIDSLGLEHRSYTSPVLVLDASENSESLRIQTHASTKRDGILHKPRLHVYSTSTSINGPSRLTSTLTRNQLVTNDHRIAANKTVTVQTLAYGLEPYTIDGRDLPAISIGGCDFATMTPERLWVAGLPRGSEIQFSDPVGPTAGTQIPLVPEFHPNLRVNNPSGIEFTGIANMQGKILVFSEEAIYGIEGRGPDASGGNDDSTGLVTLSNEYGCVNSNSIVESPAGVFFQARQGMGLVGMNIMVQFLGNIQEELGDGTIVDACHFPEMRSCLWLFDSSSESSFIVLYDYSNQIWHKWSNRVKFVSMCYHEGELWLLEQSGSVYKYRPDSKGDDSNAETGPIAGGFFTTKVRTPWYNLEGVNSGWQSLRWVSVIGERGSTQFNMNTKIYFDGDDSENVTVPITWQNMSDYGNLMFKVDSPRKRCKMFSVEISDATEGVNGEYLPSWSLYSLGFEVGRMRGVFKTGARV